MKIEIKKHLFDNSIIWELIIINEANTDYTCFVTITEEQAKRITTTLMLSQFELDKRTIIFKYP